MYIFFETFDFWNEQGGDICGHELSNMLANDKMDEATAHLANVLQDEDRTTVKFLIVPLHLNDNWVVVRIDFQHGKLYVADGRSQVIRKQHALVSPLLVALKAVKLMKNKDEALPLRMSKRKWEIETFSEELVPRSRDAANNAVMACLNVTRWALFRSINKRNNQNYADVFTYGTDRQFMLKARHFISRTIHNYASMNIKFTAKEYI